MSGSRRCQSRDGDQLSGGVSRPSASAASALVRVVCGDIGDGEVLNVVTDVEIFR
ncbi:hypothetical protein [Corynebacterium callunae]|uniref:hypothetical protein n=1 Tax=Corynebacterium callunae TaxID=1721 RepID=UPI0020000A15|nr:hypothetical protein [Corynebacterium callunae]MCK2201706.1 hypothetical protein [Corynebacterium callunae]